MNINIQPILENDNTILLPLLSEDFEELYAIASDPKIWEQHPNKNRWQKEEFLNFFQGAIESKGAFKIFHIPTNAVVGSTRFYDYDPEKNAILIGYTFFNTASWGKNINLAVKKQMLDHIFRYVSTVLFHVGSDNIRSQKAMNRLGSEKIGEVEVAYFGEEPKLNFVYRITKHNWMNSNQ